MSDNKVNTVINLDVIRAKSKKIIFLNHEFELGYITCGKSIPILEEYNRQVERQSVENYSAQSVIDDNIELVSLFTSPIVKKEQIQNEATKSQVTSFYIEIVRAIFEEYVGNNKPANESVEETGKKKEVLTA